MNGIMEGLYDTSFSVSFLIMAVIAARYLLRTTPRYLSCLLWLLVGIRLVCPIQVESVFSLVPNHQVIEQSYVGWQENLVIPSSVNVIEDSEETGQNRLQSQPITGHFDIAHIMQMIWGLGVVLMLTYSVASYLQLKYRLRFAIPVKRSEGKIYKCEVIDTSFLLGFVQPKIYVPQEMEENSLRYVIAHEKAHILRGDHFVKAISYIILAFYWFHPLVWISYILLCQDIEQACDEKVIRTIGLDCKKAYSEALLKCAVTRKVIGACPVAFGEGEVKNRVKNILRYKKPALWTITAAILLCIFVGVCFMTQQKAVGKTITNQEEIQLFLGEWANAYVGRDAVAIMERSSDYVHQQFQEKEYLEVGENYVSFGLSSPWPMEGAEGNSAFDIVNISSNSAEILYYALVSDPHVTVWRESLTFEVRESEQGNKFMVTQENMVSLDSIATAEQFYLAYPDGTIAGTWMDYQQNGLGPVLNQNALSHKDSQWYKDLFNPESAALNLLNIEKSDKVQTSVTKSQTGNIQVHIVFGADNSSIDIVMEQPYGEDGIWVVQS